MPIIKKYSNQNPNFKYIEKDSKTLLNLLFDTLFPWQDSYPRTDWDQYCLKEDIEHRKLSLEAWL